MADNWGAGTVDSPARGAVAVTPSDATVLDTTRALYVGTGGNVAVYMAGKTTSVVFPNVQDGSILPIRVDRVLSTSTTASNIVALY